MKSKNFVSFIGKKHDDEIAKFLDYQIFEVMCE